MAKTMGIDLGTANTRIVVRGHGIVLTEPSVVATDESHNEMIAVGKEAAKMAGRTTGRITVLRPLRGGAIVHCDEAEGMLEEFMASAQGAFWGHPDVVGSVPFGITEIERRAMEKVLYEAGARRVQLMDKAVLAAIGAGIGVMQPHGNMVVDIGAGTTDAAIISMGKIVYAQSCRVGGDAISGALIGYLRKKYGLIISEETADTVKSTIGTVYPKLDFGETGVHGMNAATGVPDSVLIHSRDVFDAVSDPIIQIVECVRSVLEKAPPEMAADIYDSGITLTGGTAMMGGVVELLHEITKTNVHLASSAIDATALGLGKIIAYQGDLGRLFLFKE